MNPVTVPELVSDSQFLNNRQSIAGGYKSNSPKRLVHGFADVISIDNLLQSWKEFLRGKRSRKDVQIFALDLMDNILCLHQDLAGFSYCHDLYQAFNISDPKPRSIHKATVRDRLLHHAIYRILYPFFDQVFIADSFSCCLNKGTHKALNRFKSFAYQVGQNNTRTVWVLKCDIKKFFANINHRILKNILSEYIPDKDVLWLLDRVIDSFNSGNPGVGLPLGNLTSQLLVNIYMNKFDQLVKHKLKIKHYIRYADDFVILSEDKDWLLHILPKLADFLQEALKLQLHPNKVFIKTLASGVDWLGWVNFPTHRVLRTSTKRRMFKKVRGDLKVGTVSSYLGMLKHGNGHELEKKVMEIVKNC